MQSGQVREVFDYVAHVDSNTLATESTGAANTMDVIFTVSECCCKQVGHKGIVVKYVRREIIVDHQGYLLNINASRPDIGGDENTTRDT